MGVDDGAFGGAFGSADVLFEGVVHGDETGVLLG